MSDVRCILFRMDYRTSEQYGQAVAQQLRAEIAAAGLHVTTITKRGGIPRSTLTRLLAGEWPLTVATMYRICAAIPIDPHVLLERAALRFHEQTGAPIPAALAY